MHTRTCPPPFLQRRQPGLCRGLQPAGGAEPQGGARRRPADRCAACVAARASVGLPWCCVAPPPRPRSMFPRLTAPLQLAACRQRRTLPSPRRFPRPSPDSARPPAHPSFPRPLIRPLCTPHPPGPQPPPCTPQPPLICPPSPPPPYPRAAEPSAAAWTFPASFDLPVGVAAAPGSNPWASHTLTAYFEARCCCSCRLLPTLSRSRSSAAAAAAEHLRAKRRRRGAALHTAAATHISGSLAATHQQQHGCRCCLPAEACRCSRLLPTLSIPAQRRPEHFPAFTGSPLADPPLPGFSSSHGAPPVPPLLRHPHTHSPTHRAGPAGLR
jgi:hypothetical protein